MGLFLNQYQIFRPEFTVLELSVSCPWSKSNQQTVPLVVVFASRCTLLEKENFQTDVCFIQNYFWQCSSSDSAHNYFLSGRLSPWNDPNHLRINRGERCPTYIIYVYVSHATRTKGGCVRHIMCDVVSDHSKVKEVCDTSALFSRSERELLLKEVQKARGSLGACCVPFFAMWSERPRPASRPDNNVLGMTPTIISTHLILTIYKNQTADINIPQSHN